MEEERGQIGDSGFGVSQAQRQACNVALDLHHVIQDEVAQHHDRIFAHPCKVSQSQVLQDEATLTGA